MTTIIMCSDAFDTRRVDPDWAAECEVARGEGLRVELVHWESVVAGDGDEAVRGVPARSGLAIYRGWMLTPERYALLFESLRTRGVELVTSPDCYTQAHTLPGWYPFFEGYTPRSSWLPFSKGDPIEAAFAQARELLASCPDGIMVKDYVKSRKHEWLEACFIPDDAALERVISTFVERQEEIVGGLVFREFVPLQPLGPHPRSGMPMSVELRMLLYNGKVIATMPYWPDQKLDYALPDLCKFSSAFAGLGQGLVSVDLALTVANEWIVIEVGDGQVSGLPNPSDALALYSALV